MDWRLHSALPGIAWPAIPSPQGAAVLALLYQLEQSQWLAPARLQEMQMRQLSLVLRHAYEHVPYYRNRWGAGSHALSDLPLLTRHELVDNYDRLKSESIPREHGNVAEARTSGSTGTPVRLLKTRFLQLLWNAITLRDHRWHRRDLSTTFAAIRMARTGEHESWGPATAGLVQTGRSFTLDVRADIDAQLEWLQRLRPSYLLTYPSNASALAAAALDRKLEMHRLREVRTMGELLTPEIRQACHDAWGTPLVDLYSAEEVGYVALQCPDSEHYHVQSEALLVEVLDDRGEPAPPGETGRLVVTDLHNFAMPLIRYDIGDYAEVGAPCRCGRGLPVLRRIVGRARNMLVAADGRRYWPTFGQRSFFEIAPGLRQHQFVQTAPDFVEARLVVSGVLTDSQSQALRALIESKLPAGMRVGIVQVESLARGAGGKYEDFVSEVARS